MYERIERKNEEGKEGNVLLNDTHNTVILSVIRCITYGIEGHRDDERGNPLPPLRGLLFPISIRGSVICTILHTG